MPKQPIDVALSVFTGGFNEVADPSLLARNEAQVARDVDYDSGALKGLPGPGPSGFSNVVPAGGKFLYYHTDSWLTGAADRSVLFDGKDLYMTQSGSYPVVYKTSGNVRLGLDEKPSNVVVSLSTGGALGRWIRYAITFVTDDGLESNPHFETIDAGGANPANQMINFTYDLPTDPRITKIKVYRSNVTVTSSKGYGLSAGLNGAQPTAAEYGTLFLVGDKVADGHFSDTGAPNGSSPLIHGEGGYSGSIGYTEDHSPAPNIVLFSNAIHGTTQTNGASGLLVGLDVDGFIRWNLFGYPHYWPTVNTFRPPGNVQAIVTHTAQTLIVTDRAIYSMTGLTDDTVSIGLTNANVGCLPGAGKAVVYTPYGVIFPSLRGIELFDGANSQAITLAKLKPSTLLGWAIRSAVYWDNRYLLFHDAGTLIVDLRSLPNVVLTESDLKVSAAHVALTSAPPPPPPPPPPLASIRLTTPSMYTTSDYGTIGKVEALDSSGSVIDTYSGTATISLANIGIPGGVSFTVEGQPAPQSLSFVSGVCNFVYGVIAGYTGYFSITATSDENPSLTSTVTMYAN